MLTPVVRRTFAPRGHTPIHYCWDRRDRISAISAITVSPVQERLGLYFQLLPDNQNVHGENVVEFLSLLNRQIRRPLLVFWDRSNVHDRSRVVREFLSRHPKIRTARFPAYAPELESKAGLEYAGTVDPVPMPDCVILAGLDGHGSAGVAEFRAQNCRMS